MNLWERRIWKAIAIHWCRGKQQAAMVVSTLKATRKWTGKIRSNLHTDQYAGRVSSDHSQGLKVVIALEVMIFLAFRILSFCSCETSLSGRVLIQAHQQICCSGMRWFCAVKRFDTSWEGDCNTEIIRVKQVSNAGNWEGIEQAAVWLKAHLQLVLMGPYWLHQCLGQKLIQRLREKTLWHYYNIYSNTSQMEMKCQKVYIF